LEELSHLNLTDTDYEIRILPSRAFNHPRFSPPDLNPRNTTFGRAAGSRTRRAPTCHQQVCNSRQSHFRRKPRPVAAARQRRFRYENPFSGDR